MMNKETFVYKNKIYIGIELEDFNTSDGYNMDYGVFADEDFSNADDGSLGYRMLDDRVYAYLPRELMEKGTESEIREYIKKNIG